MSENEKEGKYKEKEKHEDTRQVGLMKGKRAGRGKSRGDAHQPFGEIPGRLRDRGGDDKNKKY